jgi:hypothetical protein
VKDAIEREEAQQGRSSSPSRDEGTQKSGTRGPCSSAPDPERTGYVASVYSCREDAIVFLLFRDREAACQLCEYALTSDQPRVLFYLPLAVELRKFVEPGKMMGWPVRIPPGHPRYPELRQSWSDTIGTRSVLRG